MKAKKNQRETSIQRGALLDGLVDFYHHPLKRSDDPQTDRGAIRRTLADRKHLQTLEEQLLLRPHSQRLQPTTTDTPACPAHHLKLPAAREQPEVPEPVPGPGPVAARRSVGK